MVEKMQENRLNLAALLEKTVRMGGSDLHLTPDSAPRIRVNGKLIQIEGANLTPTQTQQLAYSVMTDQQKFRFEENLECDFSFGMKDLARFRANVFTRKGSLAAVFRVIPLEIMGLEELNLPDVISTLFLHADGSGEIEYAHHESESGKALPGQEDLAAALHVAILRTRGAGRSSGLHGIGESSPRGAQARLFGSLVALVWD